MNNENIIQKIWNLCHILRGDGISYHEYISELTYLLFLKIAEENKTEELLPDHCRWGKLIGYKGDDLLTEYRDILTFLGGHASVDIIRKIYAFPTTVFSHSENLKAVIDGIAKIDWHSITQDGMGDIYEGLLSKNSQDARSGAGQYFTPRALVDTIVKLICPKAGELIQDPAVGSGGFLISADKYIRDNNSLNVYNENPPKYEGVEIEKSTYRICLMNVFLHQLSASIILGDALTDDSRLLSSADVVLANPPFGAKAGSARQKRQDIIHFTSNKQLAFLQHIISTLKPGGRAAVVLPDNVLFEAGVGKTIRQELMAKCNLHTILRLPVGIFYSQGVKTNVLFFTKGKSGNANTSNVWFYDMRTLPVRFGKRRPLSTEDFAAFEIAFGRDPKGNSERVDQGNEGRWRSFTRDEIRENDDSLDISWLKAENAIEDQVFDTTEIAAAIFDHLREAMSEIKDLTEDFEALESKGNDD
ncbi:MULTISPECIES: class I SAM-dependent DNA methyltransferase [Mucilaginibacter]|uniref:site-specific DNA-methyltransferase (adenine-specific) n=2 Tax=Mucilaginibacter TaxID=423349 RepID=A0A6I4IC29_9SPHI|nr:MULTISPECIES: N-6 DNA methylase [Mucilaginibacter]MDT3401083.1 type I restriction enzyme M protein [Mucilaginibacter terrae]MVN91428.1 N-6 DNA methylase [Mucilaginibacter aquatilis]